MLPSTGADPVEKAARTLVTAEGKPSELTKEILGTVVTERNIFSHAVTITEEAVAREEGPLHDLWQRFKRALEGLGAARLVVQAGIVDFEPGRVEVRHKLRLLQGGSELFPVSEETVNGKLAENWCYLLRPGGAAPLSLAPMVACAVSDESNRQEVFVARTISFEPGTRVDAIGVTSKSKLKLKVP
jgi:hypothetical protein